jgi:SEC-C motif domain protein
MPTNCPCGSGFAFSACCEPIIAGENDAVTAEELMRSRYAAFTVANIDYLMRSHAAKTRPVKDRKSIEKWARSVVWMGLTVLGTETGKATDEIGYVEFKALYLEDGKPQQIHEKSMFGRENGKWVYVSGVHF